MNRLLRIICGLGLLIGAAAQAQVVLVKAGQLYTSGPAGTIENGAVLIRDGKIVQVGPASDLAVPENAQQLSAAVVLPGLIDSHTVVGVNGGYNEHADQDGFEQSDSAGAEYRVLDSFNPVETLVAYSHALGTTTVHVTPQPTAPIGGSSAVFKTAGKVADRSLLRGDVAMLFNLGLAPKDAFVASGPGTRMATAALIRAELHKARDWGERSADKRKPDLAMQALQKVLNGDILALFTAHREDDIATALRIAREFNLRALINYGTEAYLVTDLLRADEATVVLAPTMQRPTRPEKINSTLESAALLQRAGIPFVFATGYEAYVPKSRVLLWEVGVAIANGLPRDVAIANATIEPARLWGIADRVGSLEAGKDADLVLFDGDPFEYTSHITAVIVDGEVSEKRM